MDVSDEKESDERYHMDKIYEEIVTNYIELLKLGNFYSLKNTYNVEKEYDEKNRMDMIDDKESDERDQIGEIK